MLVGLLCLGLFALCSLSWLCMLLGQLAVNGSKIMFWHICYGLCKFISYVAQLLLLLAGGSPGVGVFGGHFAALPA